MSDEHDDLLNFEIAESDFADGINEDELLLSDEDRDDFDEESEPVDKVEISIETELEPEPQGEASPPVIDQTNEPSDTGQNQEKKNEEVPAVSETPSGQQAVPQPLKAHSMAHRQPFRQKFQRWPNQQPRWNQMSQNSPQQMPFSRGPPGNMMQGGPGPHRQMRPGGFPPQPRPPFFNNNFMQSRGPIRPPIRQRFFYPNSGPHGDQSMQGPPGYAPPQVMPPIAVNNVPPIPRKVHINPNFKGGVEAAKNQLMKDQFFSSPSSMLPEDELLRKQQEFINHNMRQIEKRRHERTPSPEYRRGYSHSPSPPRYRRRPNYKSYDRRRDFGVNEGKGKDENLPEEDEETRAYRQQIETQAKKREEILRQKEMRRRQLLEQKVKETLPAEPLQPIVVTDKKIVLKRKTPEKSTTPPIKDAPVTPTRRIVLKPSKESKAGVELKPALADGTKRKIQKILNS